MIRQAVTLVALLGFARAPAAEPALKPEVKVEELASPALAFTAGGCLASNREGAVWLSWADKSGNEIALRFSRFDLTAKRWDTPIAMVDDGRSVRLLESPGAFPTVSLGVNGRAAIAGISGYAAQNLEAGVWLRQTTDGGKTWGDVAWLSRDSTLDIECVTLTTLADGRLLASWLDGRDYRKRGKNVMQLIARVVGESGPDTLIDSSVPRFSQLALTAFPDGGALLAYLGCTEENQIAVRTARFHGRKWGSAQTVDHDVSRANGPRLASDGGRVVAAWFSGSASDPRVLVSYSPDAGARFLLPLRIDSGKPAGGVDALILHDGALLVTWIEADGSAWLRRVTPEFTAGEPMQLALPGSASAKTVPRLALLRDYGGGKTSAQVIVALAGDGAEGLRTFLVTVPEGDLLAAARDCSCAPTPEQLAGFPLRGAVTAIATERGAVRVQHDEIPGLLATGVHEMRVAPDVLAALAVDRQILGRVEQREGVWWIFDVRLLTQPAAER